MLADVAIASLVLTAALAASRPSAVWARLGGASAGLATGAAVALLLCAYGLWTQFHGPLAEHGTPWHIANHGNSLGAFVNPQAQPAVYPRGRRRGGGARVRARPGPVRGAAHGRAAAPRRGVLGQPAVKDGQLLAWRTASAENGSARH